MDEDGYASGDYWCSDAMKGNTGELMLREGKGIVEHLGCETSLVRYGGLAWQFCLCHAFRC